MKTQLLSYTHSNTIIDATGISPEKILPHLSYTFAIEKISRACSHQLIRHRIASYSQQSQRYVSVKELGEQVVVPPSITGLSLEVYAGFIGQCSDVYENLVESNVPLEDARFVLPNATETNLLVTMDGRALFHFFGLRCCSRAQWEIRLLADMMLKEVRNVEPELFRKAGPYCFQLGYCMEGRFSCGKMLDVKKKYGDL